MKPKLELLVQNIRQSALLSYEVSAPAFELYWHFHPEYELTYIAAGKGKRLVGDSYESFSEGDLVLLGPNVPHSWVSEPTDNEVVAQCRAFVMQFPERLLAPLLLLPEFTALKILLSQSARGLQIQLPPHSLAAELPGRICSMAGAPALAHLLLLLDACAGANCRPLTSPHFQPLSGEQNEQRINVIFQYIQSGYAAGISIREAAQQVHLSESAFCKFFKRASGKTFSDYINTLRVNQACWLLMATDKPISAIAGDCGFENLSYFNRVFRKIKGLPPGRWRKTSK